MTLFKSLLVSLLSALFLFEVSRCFAADFTPIELREVSLNYKSFFDGGSDPLITANGLPNRSLDKEIDLHLDMDLFKYLYWNNMVHSMTDKSTIPGDAAGQFRVVGWNFQFGVKLTTFLYVQYEHYSQHILDSTYVYDHFPVQDSLGIKLFIYSSPKKDGIF